MEYNYFPGRLRVRDAVFADEDIRCALMDAARRLAPDASITYNARTQSILVLYDAASFPPERLRRAVPILRRTEPKVRFYTAKKKEDILRAIEDIEVALR